VDEGRRWSNDTDGGERASAGLTCRRGVVLPAERPAGRTTGRDVALTRFQGAEKVTLHSLHHRSVHHLQHSLVTFLTGTQPQVRTQPQASLPRPSVHVRQQPAPSWGKATRDRLQSLGAGAGRRPSKKACSHLWTIGLQPWPQENFPPPFLDAKGRPAIAR
jgi:hypothetical protein